MATYEELQKGYAKKIHTAASNRGDTGKKEATEEVVADIKRYDSAAQKKLVDGTIKQLGILSPVYVRKDSENKNFLDLTAYLLSQLAGQ